MIEHQPTNKRPLTGAGYLESLRDGREVWIYGQRVQDVTSHPAFRNQARMVARLYDALHDPASQANLTCATDTGSGGYTHPFFKASRTVEELLAAREAIASWQRIGYGWMGRSPDFVASLLGMLGPNADLYAPYQTNAQRWYKLAQEQVPYVNHAIANPPIDRRLSAAEADKLYIRVVKETDAGLIVSGAKNITTNAPLTNYSFVGGDGGAFVKDKEMALLFMTPMDAPGLKVICRPSYEMTAGVMGSPFDYPLSSRFDENDAIFILDNVLVPWENVLIYGDVNKYNNHMHSSGLYHRVGLQVCTRLAVKLDFITGLLLQAVEATGVDQFRGVQVNLGEVMNWRHLFWSLSDAMVHSVTTLNGAVLPKLEHLMSYRMVMATAYPRIKEITQQLVASGLIYQPSSALDFKTPELRPYLDHYVRGADSDAVERIKLMRTLWDALSSEFGGRHELYERNHTGNHEAIRLHPLFHAMGNGTAAQLKGFAKQCMAEVDLDGWTAPDLINPQDINFLQNAGHTPVRQPTAAPMTNGFHADPHPAAPNGNGPAAAPVDAPPLTAAERHKILVDWNNTTTDYPKDKCIHQLFEEQVARTPDAVAVVADLGLADARAASKSALTYRELNERANQLAHYLQQLGVSLKTQVAICSERSRNFVVSIVAVLKAGGTYVPLDPSQPLERLNSMIEDTQPTILLTQPQWLEHLQPLVQQYPTLQLVCIERAADAINQCGKENLPLPQRCGEHCAPDDGERVAYLMYTSGSTGRPKGIAIPHRAIGRLVFNTNYIDLTPTDCIAMASNVAFDASTFEVWGTLLHGGRLVVIDRDTLLSPQDLVATLRAEGVTTLFLTTALFNQMARTIPDAFRTLRHLLFGGEAVDPRWVRTVLEQGAPQRLLHVYGPTESTTFATWHLVQEVPAHATTVPIGRALANTQLYVLDPQQQPVASGIAGELYIGGDGLAQGYWNQPEQTDEKFIPNPFQEYSGSKRLYRTGDLVRCQPDGSLEFLGRIDQQVKIRGFRIELGEIETILRQHPALADVAIMAREEKPGERQLVAYLVQRANGDLQPATLRSYLQTKLPDYMIPSTFVFLAALPLTPNGKIDRAALPAPAELPLSPPAELTLPGTPIEQVLATIWQEALDKKVIGTQEIFFDLGGHSLQATQIIEKVRKVFQVQFPLSRFFEQPTIAGLAALLVQYESTPGRAEKLARMQQRLQQLG